MLTEAGHIEVRTITRVVDEDGTELSKTYQRHVISPDSDVSGEDEITKKLAVALNTPAKVEAYIAEQDAIRRRVCGLPTVAEELALKAAMEAAEADGEVTVEERDSIFNSIKNWFKK